MLVPVEVDKLDKNVIFFNTEVATFEGGDVVMNIGDATIVVQFKKGHKFEGRYAFRVQAMMDGLVAQLEGDSNENS